MINEKLLQKIEKELIIPNIGIDRQTEQDTRWIEGLIEAKRIKSFYDSAKWDRVRRLVLESYHNECVLCKLEGKIKTHDIRIKNSQRRSLQVHHNYELYKYPEHGLEPIVIDVLGKKHVNLIPLCFNHHNTIHNKKNNLIIKEKKQLNIERW